MSKRPPPPVWQTLPQERQRGVILTLEQMALRRLRHASLAEETADERRNVVPRRGGILPEKLDRQHRERLAIVYIRQSTVQQVERHQESTRLQYALVDGAIQFGWSTETIVVIDDDLGRSGATIEGRLGFQRLVAEVGLGNVGLVLGVEMSRLARSCRDWHQLLEICALFDTLIADVDGVYDPTNYNDRLLLGLNRVVT